jgi:hypothetical protein
MSVSDTNFWLAVHLYYAEPWEAFLTEAVWPFVEKTLAAGSADQFFFIRYWERGPHIRLRFKGSEHTLTQVVQPELDAFFNRYFEMYPSEREEPKDMTAFPVERQWVPNNTLHYVPYQPEVERYGGPAGIAIAERQFQLSSQAVLIVLALSGHWDYERALGTAIQMHLGLAWALGMTLQETRHFFARIFEGWFARAYGFVPHLSAEEIAHRRQATLAAFAESFKRKQAVLVAYHQRIWQALVAGWELEQEWLNRWLCGMRKIGHELKTADARKRLIYPYGLKPDPATPVSIDRQNRWSILGSYVHMTNNRLGILNRDEAYLGYLIVNSLEISLEETS